MLSANTTRLPKRIPAPSAFSDSDSHTSALQQQQQTTTTTAAAIEDAQKQRARKKDALIRARTSKAHKHTTQKQGSYARKPKIGTVLAMKPNSALIVSENSTILEIAQTMAANRADCVLVCGERNGEMRKGKEEEGGETKLVGILTDKDLAFKVVANGMDIRNTKARDIMTANPSTVDPDYAAHEALQIMVNGHFRHLPVTDEETIYGVLDITKCFYDALAKIERAHKKSQALFDALNSVDEEFSLDSSNHMNSLLASLQEKVSSPDLATVLQTSGPIPEVSVKTSVRDAVVLMKNLKTTGVLVLHPSTKDLAGIFTSKDVVLRVLAQGLDPATTSIVRVMTPRPDTACETMTVKEALRQMHDGKYLHLPVVSTESKDTAVGLVNVLQLTYFALDQMALLQAPTLPLPTASEASRPVSPTKSTTQQEGPLWNQFWGPSNDINSYAPENESRRDEDTQSQSTIDRFRPETPSVMTSPLSSAPSWKLRDAIHDTTYRISTTSMPTYIDFMRLVSDRVLTRKDVWDGEDPESAPFRVVWTDEENDRVEVCGDSDVQACSNGRVELVWVSIEASRYGKGEGRLEVAPQKENGLGSLVNADSPQTLAIAGAVLGVVAILGYMFLSKRN